MTLRYGRHQSYIDIAMDLVTRGRLSVQRVDEKAWEAVVQLAEKGGWEELDLKPKKRGSTTKKVTTQKVTLKKDKPAARPRGKRKPKDEDEEEEAETDNEEVEESGDDVGAEVKGSSKRRKIEETPDNDLVPRRRSTRAKR